MTTAQTTICTASEQLAKGWLQAASCTLHDAIAEAAEAQEEPDLNIMRAANYLDFGQVLDAKEVLFKALCNQSGGSQKMAIQDAIPSTNGTIRGRFGRVRGKSASSLDPAKNSFYAHAKAMPCLSGDGSLTTAAKPESTAPCSETKANTSPASLSDRLTPSLISAGLVCGTIPMSMRDASGQQTLDSVLRPQAGENAAGRKADSSSSNDNPNASPSVYARVHVFPKGRWAK